MHDKLTRIQFFLKTIMRQLKSRVNSLTKPQRYLITGALVLLPFLLYSSSLLATHKAEEKDNVPPHKQSIIVTPSAVPLKSLIKSVQQTPTPIPHQVSDDQKPSISPTATTQNNTPAPTHTPTPTLTPSPTPTLTPTPTPSFYQVRGQYVDENEKPLSLPGMKITLSTDSKGIVAESTSAPYWNFNDIPTGSVSFEATLIPGYTVQQLVCFNCINNPYEKYFNSNKFTVQISNPPKFVGIKIKYIKQ